MKTQQTIFKYRKARKMVSWGCRFDSLTELKFAISIREDYEFLRERVAIYYHRGTREPTDQLRGPFNYYIPDFLIRHKITGEAFLIEVKPRAFQGHPQLALRTELAHKYIKWKKFDWKFKIVYDDEIILTVEQLEAFEECCKLKSKSSFKIWFEDYNRRFDHSSPSQFKNVSDSKMVEFIMFGKRRQGYFWQSISWQRSLRRTLVRVLCVRRIFSFTPSSFSCAKFLTGFVKSKVCIPLPSRIGLTVL